MIPTEIQDRERLIRFVQIELIASWYVCDRYDAFAKCVSEPQREKFREMAIRVVDLVEGYSADMPEPTEGRERKRTKYSDESLIPDNWNSTNAKQAIDEEGNVTLFQDE